jgi:hypothetical protein
MASEHVTIREVKGTDTLDSWIVRLEEAAKPESYKSTSLLEALLSAAFADTQVRTHVISGSLKASGKTESDFDGNVWSGKIEYGGVLFKAPVPGPPRDPVDYAIYEMARGGSHDFFGGLPAFEEKIPDILNTDFPG